MRNVFGSGTGLNFALGGRRRTRVTPSATKQIILWGSGKHICHICLEKIHSLRDAHLDHIKAFKNGGKSTAWAHARCNLLKSHKGLAAVQKELGVYRPKKRPAKTRARRNKSPGLFDMPSFKSPKGGWL